MDNCPTSFDTFPTVLDVLRHHDSVAINVLYSVTLGENWTKKGPCKYGFAH